MSDELTVVHGTAVQINTEELREAARRVGRIVELVRDAQANFSQAEHLQASAGLFEIAWWRSASAFAQTERAAQRTGELADGLANTANLYEATEILLTQRLTVTPDAAAARRLQALYDDNPELQQQVEELLETWAKDSTDTAWAQAYGLSAEVAGLSPLLALHALVTLGSLRRATGRTLRGAIPYGTRPYGDMPNVTVTKVTSAIAMSPPRSFDALAAGVPNTGAGRVTVDTYTARDGKPVSIVYISPTRPGGTKHETHTWNANPRSYRGEASSSYAAVRAAMDEAGIAPGSRVALVGYSQGAMNAEQVAATGDYDVAFVGTFGSPVEADLSDDTAHVQFLHADDPLTIARNGGVGAPSGSPESAIVSRTVDPLPTAEDKHVPGHEWENYRETARLADQSDERSLVALREKLAELTDGQAGTRTIYATEVKVE